MSIIVSQPNQNQSMKKKKICFKLTNQKERKKSFVLEIRQWYQSAANNISDERIQIQILFTIDINWEYEYE